ncbi:MAG: hypothetical protein EXS16_06575 [Gemmataceae bacterium]|nr:hypothetical protein [Gemmataceae bacterium]
MITSTDIRSRLNRQPFSPFRIRTSSGQAYDVLHPEFAIVGKRVVVVGIPSQQDDPEFDQAHVVSILHVSALETLLEKVHAAT